ncbi:carboxypeptidase-like regulatory domain-containing protein [Paraflavitalea pollutisoli]|uniref:carboxypeptidase-like regulatory domain-containing protein n=1 Tax=Paraflavitalea pollutisoli TaxID=3034143 RepID=UPI0023EC5E35|nr:carboxypeptidase-like regulatory domain-containing protein [Paraflavitalea sp. H1-2-19X]
MINIFPEFESRQVLTADELNWMACYLDTQERQSRRFLIGCGLIGGLQVKLVNNAVQVTHGIGITSAGHIVSLTGAANGITSYTKQKPYTQGANEKLAYHYLPDLDPQAENYAQSVDQPSRYFPGFTGPILELMEDTINDATPIDGNTLTGRVVLLFAEIIQKELKDCEGDNCQERGKKYIFKSKVLVITREDALLLLSKEYNNIVQSEDAVSKQAFPWLHLPNVNILKPVFSNKSVNTVFSEKVLVDEYSRCIKDFRDMLTNNKLAIEQALSNLRNYCTITPANITLVDTLVAKINSTNVLSPNNLSPSLTGVVYDYLWCFVKAYQELQAAAQHLKAKCFTNESAFPNHILLGQLANANNDFDVPVTTGYSVYRHYFQSRLVQTQQAEVAQKVLVCLKRLVALVTAFDDAALPGKKDIRITTGGNLYDPLSTQAMPYYLKTPTAAVWNVQATHANLNKYNTTYNSTNDNQTPSVNLAYNTLSYAMQGNHAFFRIEGIYGQPAVNALNAVFQLRKKHGMAFEVLMLRLNEKAPFSHSFNFTINEDVDSMYQVVRAEVLKQISLNVSYLWGRQLKAGKFNPIRTVLEAELEKSFMFFLANINSLLKAKPLEMVLNEAIMASNITTNYKAKAYTTEAKYSDLETMTAEAKPVTQTLAKQESVGISYLKYNPAYVGIFQPIYTIGALFFNTLGNLVDTIKRSDKFKNTSDISFYSHLLKVVKGMQKGDQSKTLFLHVLRLYCALKLQEEYLAENFLELDITKYRDNLEDELIPASDAMMDYLRPFNFYFNNITSDEILYEVNRDEMMEYAGRVKFDDDWIKIIQLDAENKKRNGGLGVENLLEKFVKLHPGIAHGCGVPKGGTYLMIYDAANQVVADFYLPYIIASHLRPIQFTLVENKTITLSGTVKDQAGAIMAGVTVLVGGATVVTDKDGFYTALVTENTTVKVICKVAGYQDYSKDVVVASLPKEENIILTKVPAAKFKTTINFRNQNQIPITKLFTLLNKDNNTLLTVDKGVLVLTEEPKKKFNFIVKDDSFDDTEFSIETIDKDQTLTVSLIELDFFRIQLIGQPDKYIASLLNSIKVIDPEMELDMSKVSDGFFVTKQRGDITKSAKAAVVYNSKPVQQAINAGPDANKIFVDSTTQEPAKKLPFTVGVMYPQEGDFNRIKGVKVNGSIILVDEQTDLGKGEITTKGEFNLMTEFPNVKSINMESFKDVKFTSLIIDSVLTISPQKVTDDMLFTFTRTVTSAQKSSLIVNIPRLRRIAEAIQEGSPTFYCMLITQADFDKVAKILAL